MARMNYKDQIDGPSKQLFYNIMNRAAGRQIKNFEFSTDVYSVWDAKITTTNNIELYFELKYRRFPHNRYPDTLLNKSKYDRLLDFTINYGKANIGNNGLRGVCCLFVPMFEDRLYLFDLSTVKPKFEYRTVSITTDFSNNQMVETEVCLFDFKDGKEVIYG